MSRAGKSFQLGDVVVPITAALGLQQSVELFGGAARLRMADGAGVAQVTWRKHRITLSGDGWAPLGLRGMSFDGPLVLRCGLPEAVTSASNAITLPAARRIDAGYEPFARAHTADGDIDTAVSLAGNVATCTAVSGAIGYSVMYYPQITVLADPPATSFDRGGATSSWEIVCEEQ